MSIETLLDWLQISTASFAILFFAWGALMRKDFPPPLLDPAPRLASDKFIIGIAFMGVNGFASCIVWVRQIALGLSSPATEVAAVGAGVAVVATFAWLAIAYCQAYRAFRRLSTKGKQA